MIKGLHFVRRRQPWGITRWYVYAWRGGPCIHKSVGKAKPRLGSAELQKLQLAMDVMRPKVPTNLQSLVSAWRLSPEWGGLSAGTRKTWGSALARIEERWGQTPLTVWNDPRMTSKVITWRDSRSATPRAADVGVMVLRALLSFGRLRSSVAINVAIGIPTLYRNGQRAEIVWTRADIRAYVFSARKLGREQMIDGIRLAALTGLRRDDLVSLTWDQVGEFAITKRALKRSAGKRRHVSIPLIPALTGLLAELRTRQRKDGVNTVLVNSFGAPWSADGFGGSFNRIRDDAGVHHEDQDTGELIKKHLHDLRGTYCTELITTARLTDREIADIMGWAPDRVATIRRVYVDQSSVMSALGKRLVAVGQDEHSFDLALV